jgi:hypothetical protein
VARRDVALDPDLISDLAGNSLLAPAADAGNIQVRQSLLGHLPQCASSSNAARSCRVERCRRGHRYSRTATLQVPYMFVDVDEITGVID